MARARHRQTVKLVGAVRPRRTALLVSTALCATVSLVVPPPAGAQPAANTLPTGGVVFGGNAAISQGANQTTINQASQRAAINWQTFNVGSQAKVQFNQPNAGAVTLNRVVTPNPSQIAGRIDANGQVVLENQSGVIFYKGSQVNTSGLMVSAASSSDAATRAFLNGGNLVMDQPANPDATVINQGHITIRQAGLAALVAPAVRNDGVIVARLGHIVLASGTETTLDLYGDGMMSIDVSGLVRHLPNGATALVTNTGTIIADGGTVQLSAREADSIVQTLVDAGGTIRASTVGGQAGTIILAGVGGSINIEGQLEAQGMAQGTAGGNIVADASGNVNVASTARIDASGQAGGGVVAIGTTLQRAIGGLGVTATHTATNVTILAGAQIAANATANGNGGRVTVLSTGTTVMDGTISATGGTLGGNGGFVETSGEGILDVGADASVTAAAPNGSPGQWLMDPDSNVLITSSGSQTVSCNADFVCAPTVDSSVLLASTINNALNNGTSVKVTTTNANGTQAGTITVGNIFDEESPNDGEILLSNRKTVTLTLDAGSGGGAGSIVINAPITDTGSNGALSLVLSAPNGGINVYNTISIGGNLNATAGSGGIGLFSTVTAGGMASSLISAGPIDLESPLATPGGSLTIQSGGDVFVYGSVTSAGNIAIAAGTPNSGLPGELDVLAGVTSTGGNVSLSATMADSGDDESGAYGVAALFVGAPVQAGPGATLSLTAPSIVIANIPNAEIGEGGCYYDPAECIAGSLFVPFGTSGGRILLTTGTLTVATDSGTAPGPLIQAPSGVVAIAPMTQGNAISVHAEPNTASGLLSLFTGTMAASPTLESALSDFSGLAISNLAEISTGNTVSPMLGSLELGSANAGITAGNITFNTDLDPVSLNNAGTLALYANGAITEPASALTVNTLIGSAGGGVTMTNGNQIGTLGPFSVTGGSFAVSDIIGLTVGGPVNGGTSATINDGAALTVIGSVTSTGNISLTGSSIAITGSGYVSDGGAGTTSLVATAGTIDEAGTLIAGTLSGSASDAGSYAAASMIGANGTANTIAALGSFFASRFTLDDNRSLTVNGVVGDDTSVSVTLPQSAALTIAGTIMPAALSGPAPDATGVRLTAGNIAISGTVSDGGAGTTSLIANGPGGMIQENGALIAGTLSGAADGAANLLDGPPSANQVATLASFSAARFVFDDGRALTVNGPISAAVFTISAVGQLTLAGNIAITGATPSQQFGAVTNTSTLDVLPNPENGTANFVQSGNVTVSALAGTALYVQLPATGGTATFAGLNATGIELVLGLGNGSATGTMEVGGLLVQGQAGSATLFGSVGGITTGAAAAAQINPAINPVYLFNDCEIGASSCGQSQTITPITPIITPIQQVDEQSVLGGLEPFIPGLWLPPVPPLPSWDLIVLGSPPLLPGQFAPPDVVPPDISFEDY